MTSNTSEIQIHEVVMRVRDLPLVHRADMLVEQLNEMCLELNIELYICCESCSIRVLERTHPNEMAHVESHFGMPWIDFDDESQL
jgi:hypothetical protein